jgi:nucleotide-binding universal stress UspA family protein
MGYGWGMSKRVFVATDLSEAADEALRQGHERASADGATLIVAHVLPAAIHHHPLYPHIAESSDDTERKDTLRELAARVEQVTGRKGDQVTLVVREGTPHAAIVEIAEDMHADLVIVGSHGHSRSERILFGSIADKVIRHAHSPVLVARKVTDGPIVCGTDFSERASLAVEAAIAEAKRTGARLILVHAMELGLSASEQVGIAFGGVVTPLPSETREELERLAQERLNETLRKAGVAGEGRVEHGSAAKSLVEAAELIFARLIVVGTAGKTGLRRALLGSVAEAIARTASCSVLVVRPKAA